MLSALFLSTPILSAALWLDLAKIVAVPLFLWLASRYYTRHDKQRDEAAATVKAELRERNEKADKERQELQSRLKALDEKLATETSERVQWQLKREMELASIAGILEESTEAHKLLASIAATTQAHGSQLSQLYTRLDSIQNHVNALTLLHAKP